MDKIKLITAGAVAGAAVTLALAISFFRRPSAEVDCGKMVQHDPRSHLPKRIILIRHGESEGNADHTLYRTKADNLIELTPAGIEQATAAGKRLKALLGNDRVVLYVSPFERTLETARCLRTAIEKNIIKTWTEPLLREQEFGNLQGDDFKGFREEQKRVGRFFYRFPTGESGADVYGRTKLWWNSEIDTQNQSCGLEKADAIVVVTHGLTMRLILMQMFSWSPNTFSSVWNAGNCDMYVLNKDDSIPGCSPYQLDEQNGDALKSSLDVVVTFTDGRKETLKLTDYLKLTSPRTLDVKGAIGMLAKQHDIDVSQIETLNMRKGRAGYDRFQLPEMSGGWSVAVRNK